MNTDEKIISFEAITWPFYERGKYWIIISFSLIGIIILISIFTNALSMGLLAASIGIWYVVHHKNEPECQTITITKNEIGGEKWKYSFKKIKSFWILQIPNHPPVLHLILHSEEEISVIIPPNQHIIIKQILKEYITEDETREEKISDTFIRVLKL